MPECLGELQIDPPSQISQPGGAGSTVKGGRHGNQPQPQVQGDNETIVGKDQPPEERQILQARTTDEDGRSAKGGGQARMAEAL